jgi:hypothetical protein
VATIYNPLVLVTFSTALLLTIFGTVEAANIPHVNRPAKALILGMLVVFSLIHLAVATEFIYIQF